MYLAWRRQWCELLRQYGLRNIRDLVGRTDLLVHLDYLDESEKGNLGSSVRSRLAL
jgi:hypothetical protein